MTDKHGPGPGEDLIATTRLNGGRLIVVPSADGTNGGRGLVILLHGAGSGTDSPVLSALAARLGADGVPVARLEMPYRVAGKRFPDRAVKLDAVLRAAVELAPSLLRAARPLALAGASMGSRVACRCALDVGAVGVLALGFPLQPPGGRPSRAVELAGAGVPVQVVQGERDTFGRPADDPGAGVAVHVVAGADHSFGVRKRDGRSRADVVNEAVSVGADWLVSRLDIAKKIG